MTLPALACTDGVLPLELLMADPTPDAGTIRSTLAGAGGEADGSGGTGKSAGRGGGPFGEPRAGAGGTPSRGMMLPPTPCEANWDSEGEDALRDAFNEALSNGRLCPRESTGLNRRLANDADLHFGAQVAVCWSPSSRTTWGPLPQRGTLGWFLTGTPSLEEAKKALVEDSDRTTLCEQAKDTPFRAIGVAHADDRWSVVISPGVPEDMHRDDMQKP